MAARQCAGDAADVEEMLGKPDRMLQAIFTWLRGRHRGSNTTQGWLSKSEPKSFVCLVDLPPMALGNPEALDVCSWPKADIC
jgi:hypothetical protein